MPACIEFGSPFGTIYIEQIGNATPNTERRFDYTNSHVILFASGVYIFLSE